MARVLIAGCGYVGSATANLFHAAGWEVEGWTSSLPTARAPYSIRAVDLTNVEAIRQASGRFDVIIQAASSRGGDTEAYRKIYLQAARNLVEIFPDSRLLFTSSTSVYAQEEGEWVSESSAADPERETGGILRETEDFVLAAGGMVARLAGIYGPGRSALLKKFLAGEAVLDGKGERFLNQIHRDDVAAALLLLVRQDWRGDSADRIYNVADSNPITQRAAYTWLAEHLHRPLPPISLAPAPRRRGSSNKRVSSEKLRALGWSLRYPTFEIAMRESILPAAGVGMEAARKD